MPINKIAYNLLASATPDRLGEQKLTFAELEELVQRDDFDAILTAAGIPNPSVVQGVPTIWSKGEEFDASKFNGAAYKKYQRDFFKK